MEKRKSTHILVQTIEEANAVLKKIEEGQSIEDLAQDLSICPSGKASKGDIGYFEKGKLVPEYDKKLFEMSLGEISEPIYSRFGYHIIQFTDVKDN